MLRNSDKTKAKTSNLLKLSLQTRVLIVKEAKKAFIRHFVRVCFAMMLYPLYQAVPLLNDLISVIQL